MNYKLLGNSGLRVSELCLGTMTFGTQWGWGADEKECQKIFDAYVDAGGNFIDTANKYTNGTSEKYVGNFIKKERDHFVVATKYTLSTKDGDPNRSGSHRKNLVHSVEASLKRLDTGFIDLLWVHAWDPLTPMTEVMRALDDLVKQGKILHVGISDTPAWVISRANAIAEAHGWTPFSALQAQYSLIERTSERDLIPMSQALGITTLAWGPLAAGILTGKYNKDPQSQGRASKLDTRTQRNLKIADTVLKVAEKIKASPAQVALSWLLQQPGNIIPILGARSEKQLQDNLGCLTLTLNKKELDTLNKASEIELGFPHDFLNREFIKLIRYGGTLEKTIIK